MELTKVEDILMTIENKKWARENHTMCRTDKKINSQGKGNNPRIVREAKVDVFKWRY